MSNYGDELQEDLEDVSESDMDDEEEEDEENNNIDNEDDHDHDEETHSVPMDYSSPSPPPDEPFLDEDPPLPTSNGNVPRTVNHEIVVDNDEDIQDAVVDNVRAEDVEIVGENIAVEVISETAVIPDTEDDTDEDNEDSEYPLPVINTATTEEVLGISSDDDTGGTVEAAEDTLEATEPDGAEISVTVRSRSRDLSPQPGPSTSGTQRSTSGSQYRYVNTVVRSSRGKRLPWRDNDYNSSDSEEDELSVSGPQINLPSPIPRTVSSAPTIVPNNSNNPHIRITPGLQQNQSQPRSRDFDQRRFWRQLSSTNEDLGRIEPTVTAASGCNATCNSVTCSRNSSACSSHEIRVRPVSHLFGPVRRGEMEVRVHSPGRPSLQPSPAHQGSHVPTLPNTTIRRIMPINTIDLLPPPTPILQPFANPGSVPPPPDLQQHEPARIEPVPSLRSPIRSPSPVSPPQSTLYSPVQLTNHPPITTPRFEPPNQNRPGLRLRSPPPSFRDRERFIETARDLNRIDRILELSRRSRQETIRQAMERERREDQDDIFRNRIMNLREERLLTQRSSEHARRSFERAQSAMARNVPGTIHEDIANEFVRDSTPNTPAPDANSGAPASKRQRMDIGYDNDSSRQYNEDIAEALSRSLIDQGGEPTGPSRLSPSIQAPEAAGSGSSRTSGVDPGPGCSHWGLDNSSSTAAAEVTPAASPAVQAVIAVSPAVDNGPDYETMYKTLLTSNKKLIQELQSSLECPVCLETIRTAPVQCCRNGHLICNVCITRAQICPTCRAPMGLSMSMKCVSHVANRLIDLLPHPCTNKDRGCTVEELLTTLTQHESECRFRDVRCPVGYCLETVPMSSLPTHISSPPHSCTTRNCDDLLSQVRAIPCPNVPDANVMRSFDPIRFSFNNTIFYLQTIASPDRRFLYNFIQIEGSKTDCQKFWATVSVKPCDNFTSCHASATLQPITLDQHCRDDLQAIGVALVTPERLMGSIMQYDDSKSQFQFQVEVKMSQI